MIAAPSSGPGTENHELAQQRVFMFRRLFICIDNKTLHELRNTACPPHSSCALFSDIARHSLLLRVKYNADDAFFHASLATMPPSRPPLHPNLPRSPYWHAPPPRAPWPARLPPPHPLPSAPF